MFYGLDVHKLFLQVCALTDVGREREDERVGGHPDAIESFARRLSRGGQVARVRQMPELLESIHPAGPGHLLIAERGCCPGQPGATPSDPH